MFVDTRQEHEMTRPKIGFIGLGLMGAAMVERLQVQGYAVTVLGHKNRSGIEEAAVSRGAQEADDARALAEASDIIILCMGTSDQVEGRMHGRDGVIAGLQPGAVVVDFGTSLPTSTRALSEEVAAAQATMLDAPLGRTPTHAAAGLLNIMCAGDPAIYKQVKPVLEDLGENIFHLGPLGSGHTIKRINNFFGMTVANAMAEAFAMADKAGVPRQEIYCTMSAGPLHSGMMGFLTAYALERDPAQLAFRNHNSAKDVGYYTQMAETSGVQSLMSQRAQYALDMAVQEGRGDDMVSQMVNFYADRFCN